MKPAIQKDKLARLQMDLLVKSSALRSMFEEYRGTREDIAAEVGDADTNRARLAALKARMDVLEAERTPLAQLVAACKKYEGKA
jgi:hypothetical protein